MVVMFLFGWKLNETRSPIAPMRRPLPLAAHGLRRILHDPQAMAARDGVQGVAVHRQSGKIHRQQRARRRRDGGLDALQIDVAGQRIDVHEPRPARRPPE